jgi:hypothetical protein
LQQHFTRQLQQQGASLLDPPFYFALLLAKCVKLVSGMHVISHFVPLPYGFVLFPTI